MLHTQTDKRIQNLSQKNVQNIWTFIIYIILKIKTQRYDLSLFILELNFLLVE